MDYLVGIDLGSTTLKAVIYDAHGNVVASGCRPTERFHPDPAHPEWTVWQPEQIWGGSAAALQEAVAAIGDPRKIKAVVVTGMGMDGVPIDEQGHWLYPLISWHCPRTQPQFEWWIKNIGAEKTFATGGNTLWRFSTALRLLWMAEHEPEILDRTHKWLLIEDFVNYMLCGVAATDYTMASCTLLFDQRKLTWSDEMLALSGIDRRLLCDAFPSGTVLGGVTPAAAEATGLAAGTPVVLGGHDYLCGALPVGAITAGRHPGRERHLGDRAGVHSRAGVDPRSATDRCDGGGARGAQPLRRLGWRGLVRHAGVVSQGVRLRGEASSRAVQRCGLGLPDGRRGQVTGGRAGAMFLPHMSGAGCPVVDSRSLGGFVGLSSFVTKGDMLRAVIEGLDYQFLDIVRTMQNDMGVPFEKLVVVGGAVRNKFWMQNKADMVGLTIEAPAVEDGVAAGRGHVGGRRRRRLSGRI